MQVDMTGRVAVITGGSKGLGLAIATRMAESGADIALLARGADALQQAQAHVSRTAKGEVHTFQCDVMRADAIASTFAAVMGVFGRVDIVVNNAGQSQTGEFASITDDVWQADLDLKLFAAIRLTRLAWPQWLSGGGGG